jgi:hypothetical protein
MTTISIVWIIERLLVKPTEGTLTDVVITADWRCNGTETTGTGDDEKTYSGTCYGSASFAPPTGSFTPYPDLTEQQVLGWCFSNGVDQTAIEANVSLQIENQINPPVIAPPLPWVEPVPPPQPEMIVPPMLPQVEPVLVTQADSKPSSAQEIVAPVQDVTDAPAA